MPPSSLLRLVVAVIIISLPTAPATAQSWFDRLVMPGPLVKGHAEYEKECNKCHEPYSKGSQTQLCLDCHKDVAADRSQSLGLHGRRPDAVKAECNHCHTEHKGRDADIVQFDRETFDHGYTDFTLKGAHETARCEGCHKPAVAYRKAPQLCIDCHKKDEPHKGRLGEKCDSCHNENAWRSVKPFDHSQTRFSLAGAHEKVACNACHAGERYKGISTICADCHQLQDVHGGRYGAKCDNCHRPEKWNVIRFDHDRQTKFALRGKHQQTKCDTCHTGDLYRDKLSTACVSCHKKNDPHEGQLGTQCETCHNETGWRQKVAFDHDLTRFPLIGLHGLLPCEECHRTQSFKDVSTQCSSCHEDTYHKGRFGPDCAQCHNPNGWELWRFNHDRQTDFPLTGAHRQLTCHLCHRESQAGQKISLSSTCYACHANDDEHQGSFGRQCDKCHTTESFGSGGFR